MIPARLPSRARGFTLIELLVVILIILLLTAVALPTVIPAINSRKVSSAALILQAELARIRDAAIRANVPRGVRFIPETVQSQFVFRGNTPGYTRMIAIEPGPQYSEGLILPGYPSSTQLPQLASMNPTFMDITTVTPTVTRLVISEAKFKTVNIGGKPIQIPNPPTSWFWNIRVGDKIRFNNSGQTYTIAGPDLVNSQAQDPTVNPERYVNWGYPSATSSNITNLNQEFLFLVNGKDDNGDGYTDEPLDGIDNDRDGFIDPGYNGRDDNGNGVYDETAELALNNYGEYEPETFANPLSTTTPSTYTIYRRPVPSPGSREIALPQGTVIDLTTWNSPPPLAPERSRLPIDPLTGYTDIMMNPNGQILQAGATSMTSDSAPVGVTYFHFWICDVEDVYEPVYNAANNVPYALPMPMGTVNYPNANDATNRFLKGERRLVSVNTRSGQVVTTAPENFNALSTLTLDSPYLQAQAGVKEEP
jgi:prepilin-type N-terminal cleavage/methylation domain-containing protein